MSYLSIDSNEIVQTINNELNRLGIEYSATMSGSQANHWIYYKFPELRFTDPSGVECFNRLAFKNSTNKTSAFMVALGAFRVVCANGLVWGTPEFSQRIVHREGPKARGFLEQFPDLIATGLQRLQSGEVAEEMFRLAEVEVSKESAIEAICSLNISPAAKRRALWMLESPRAEDAYNNLYSLFNLTNEALRREHGGNSVVYGAKNQNLAQELELLTTYASAA